jgi:hypothetical protein
MSGGVGPDAALHLLDGGGAGEVDGVHDEEVQVRVVESGRDEAAAQFEGRGGGPDVAADLGVRPHREDPVAGDGEGLRARP